MDARLLVDDSKGAILSDCRNYRYKLWRKWDVEKPQLAWVMLNPSTADESKNDATIRRCIGYAKDWGYGSIVVGNLFSYRATKPVELWNKELSEIVGPHNDYHLEIICEEAEKVVAAWGFNGEKYGRGREVVENLGNEIYALGTTKKGQPVHPLYQPSDAELIPYGGDSE